MKIFLTHLDYAVSEQTLESLRKDVSYFILNHPEVLNTQFNRDLHLTKDHLKPSRFSFGVSLEVMPYELSDYQPYLHVVKQRKPRASREEMERRIFKHFARFRL